MTTETPDAPASTDIPAPQPAPQPAPLPSPGAMIREARERAHLSIEDMAAHTKLARGTLDALERDDYAALLEPVYVRGYYRKCAKVLEIDEERLIAAYNARVSPKAPEAPSKLRLASGTELGSSSRLPVSMAVLAAVVAVVACAFLWFARDGVSERAPPAPAATHDSEPVPASVLPAEPATAEPVTPPPAAEDPAATPDTGTAPATEAAPEQPATAQAAADAPAATASTGTVRLRFAQDSWVRVDDAAGKTLVNEMRRAGTMQAFTGQPPLSVFLGNAPGVQAEYGGRSIDVTPYVRDNNTARFSVPQ